MDIILPNRKSQKRHECSVGEFSSGVVWYDEALLDQVTVFDRRRLLLQAEEQRHHTGCGS
jgi:hypothetical protein